MKIFIRKNLKTLSIAIVLVAIGFFVGTFLKSNNIQKETSKYTYIDISRNFILQEHYITNIQPLRNEIKKMAEEFGNDKVSIYIEFLNTGANISINPENYIWPASLLKLPLGMGVMKKVELGEWDLNSQLVLIAGDIDNRSGDQNSRINSSPMGTRFTVSELLVELLTNSDNSAYDILARNTSNSDIQRLIDAVGLDQLATDNGKISAKEYSRLLRSLYTASFLNRENSQKVLMWLDDSAFDNYISRGIPQEIPFPHKYGRNIKSNVYADSGIVYLSNRPYIISIMVQGDVGKTSEEEQQKALKFIEEVSSKTYNYFLNFGK